MKPIPFSTNPNKPIPDESNANAKPMPVETSLTKKDPVENNMNKAEPVDPVLGKDVPVESPLVKEDPQIVPKENCVIIDGQEIEIKPTKLKYFRNKMASAYYALKTLPLNEVLAYGKNVIDENRDADQVLFDFLVAVFDDARFVKSHYDNMTADDVEQIFKIFGRINHIDEKEELKRKNMEAQART